MCDSFTLIQNLSVTFFFSVLAPQTKASISESGAFAQRARWRLQHEAEVKRHFDGNGYFGFGEDLTRDFVVAVKPLTLTIFSVQHILSTVRS